MGKKRKRTGGRKDASVGKAYKPRLTPEQERYVDKSFKRFDALYRKLAE